MVRSFEAFRLHPRKPESGLERHQNVACSHDGARRWNVPSLAPPSFMLAALSSAVAGPASYDRAWDAAY
jgi:hypothetical protein